MKAHAQMGDTVRRLLALAAVVALVAVGCSDESEGSGADETTPTEQPAAGTAVAVPTINLAPGGSNVATNDQRTPVGPIGSDIAINVVSDVGSVEPKPGEPIELLVASPRWRVENFGFGDCPFATGEIVTTSQAAQDLNLNPLSDSLGKLGGQDIIVAEVDPGSELASIQMAVAAGGLASFHYPVAPQPRWKYAPAGAPETVKSDDVTSPIVSANAPVLVIDYFLDSVDRDPDFESEVDEYLEKFANVTSTTLSTTERDEFVADLERSDAAVRGHGEFIVGILNRLGVEASEVHVGLTGDRVSDENTVAAALNDGANFSSNVVNLSMGIAPCTVEWDGNQVTLPPLGVAAAMLQRAGTLVGKSPVVIAAAGNHGTSTGCVEPYYPAAFSGDGAWPGYVETLDLNAVPIDLSSDIAVLQQTTVSVGATGVPQDTTGADSTRAAFSACDADNLTVWAPGTNVISDYQGGLAAWSGTSFATPQIAAALALGLLPQSP